MSLYLATHQQSNDVVALQHALNESQPKQRQLKLDGIFGSKTETAVRRWQQRQRLTIDGIAGPQTLGTLFRGVEVEWRVRISTELFEPQRPAMLPGSRYPLPAAPRQSSARSAPGRPGFSLGSVDLARDDWGQHRALGYWNTRQEAIERWIRQAEFPKPQLDFHAMPPLSQLISEEPTIGTPPTAPAARPVGFSASAEVGSAWTGGRSSETAFKAKFVVGKHFSFAGGGKHVYSGKTGEGKVGLHAQANFKPFYILNHQWSGLGRVRVNVAPALITSYTVSKLSSGPYHKVGGGGVIGADFTVRLFKDRVFAGLGLQLGGMCYMEIGPKSFRTGYYPVLGGSLSLTRRF